jgi:hypothetical protein
VGYLCVSFYFLNTLYIVYCIFVHCTLYIVHCTLYIVYCILYIVHCILYIVYCTLYIVHCILYIVYCTLYIVHCTLYIVYLYIVHCTLYIVYFSPRRPTNLLSRARQYPCKVDPTLIDCWFIVFNATFSNISAISKPGANPRRIGDRLVWVVRSSNYLTHWAKGVLIA